MAKKAQQTYNNTYMGASRIKVDSAKLKGEEPRDQTRERSRDESKKRNNSEEKVETFESYKRVVQERAKKSWDDLLVPKHSVAEEF